jgi:hypothetical protein
LWQVEVSTKRKYEKIMINPASMCIAYHFWYTKVAFSQVYTHTRQTTKVSDTRDLIFSFTGHINVAPALEKLTRWCCHECVIRKSGHEPTFSALTAQPAYFWGRWKSAQKENTKKS